MHHTLKCNKKLLTIACIPACNEEYTIAKVVSEAKKHVDKVLVVDDGSTDRTASMAKCAGAEVMRLRKTLGKGTALQCLFERAIEIGADIIVTLDADGTHRPEEIPLLLHPILTENPSVDMVVGSRFMKASHAAVSALNFAGNKLFNLLIFLLTGKFLSDSQSGFRAFKSWILNNFDLASNGYEIESELTIKCVKHRFKILEIPIKSTWSLKVSKLRSFKDGLKILRVILKTALRN
jgi:glycosyltransferase involved in cell wall biosynthesis